MTLARTSTITSLHSRLTSKKEVEEQEEEEGRGLTGHETFGSLNE